MPTNTSLAEQLLACRLAADLTLREAAEATGVPHSRLSEYERGHRTPTLERLIDVVEGLGGSVALEIDMPLTRGDRDLVAMHRAMTPTARLLSLSNFARLRTLARPWVDA